MGRRPDPLGGDCSTGPWQRTGAVGKTGPTHPDDTPRGTLQMGRRTGILWLLDHCDERSREDQSLLTFDLQWRILSSTWHINWSVCSHFFTFTLMTTTAFVWNSGKLFSALKLVPSSFVYFVWCVEYIAMYAHVWSALYWYQLWDKHWQWLVCQLHYSVRRHG